MPAEGQNPDEQAQRAKEIDALEVQFGPEDPDLEHVSALTTEIMDLTDPNGNHKDTLSADVHEALDSNAGPLEIKAFMREAGAFVDLGKGESVISPMMMSDAELCVSQTTESLEESRKTIAAILDKLVDHRAEVVTSTGERFDIACADTNVSGETIPVENRRVYLNRNNGRRWDEVHGAEPKNLCLNPNSFLAYLPNENIAAPLNDPANPRNWNDRGVAHFLETEIMPGLEGVIEEESEQ